MAGKLGMSFENFYSNFASSNHGFKDETTIKFTIAHELGHIVLKHCEDNYFTQKEDNCFARNLISPIPLVNRYKLNISRDYVRCFGISEPMAEVSFAFAKVMNIILQKRTITL